jgi:hypothetical protein
MVEPLSQRSKPRMDAKKVINRFEVEIFRGFMHLRLALETK